MFWGTLLMTYQMDPVKDYICRISVSVPFSTFNCPGATASTVGLKHVFHGLTVSAFWIR